MSTAGRIPEVSVLLAVHNGADYVAEAVESILAQTRGNLELIIIDDGSTDATAQIIDAYRDARIRIIRNERNIGLARSLNLGIDAAQGLFVARQDADDISAPHRLEVQLTALEAASRLGVVGCLWEMCDV